MPELPEVETVRRGLVNFLPQRRINEIQVLHPRANRKGSLPLKSVIGSRILEVNRRGKFLWFTLDRSEAIVGHLGMSGQMLIQPTNAPHSPHTRVIIRFSGAKDEFRFIDQRTFGWLAVDELVESENLWVPKSCSHIAPDPFEPNFNLNLALGKLASRKTEIKRALLNQEIISGIGNIYADEALWRSKIHPEHNIERLTEKELRLVIQNATKVMRDSLGRGGTSFDDLYIDVNGQSGYFAISLKAYGREGEPCKRCGTAIRRITFANRSSHFCPTCQKAPRTRSKPGKNRVGNRNRKGSSR
ncbi:MAG: bifunctional DNA-formamidopyrimidine glycosylase/DNA-(apurinic or apyrimidinic site) lyase [Actinomycetota bacterium]